MIELDTVSSDDLIAELRRRSAACFIVIRPLAGMSPDQPYGWQASWGVDGGKDKEQPEDFARVLGLVEISKCVLLNSHVRST